MELNTSNMIDNQRNSNRLKAVLADTGQANKWLAVQLGKYPVTVSKWCTEPHNLICSHWQRFLIY